MKLIGKISLLIILLLLAFFIVLLKTPLGLHSAVFLANAFVPELKIEDARGNLAEVISIKKLSFENAENFIELKNIKLHWNILRLLRKRITITEASIQSLNIKHLANDTPLTEFTLPLQLTIRQAAIHHFSFSYNQQTINQFRQLVFFLHTAKEHNLQKIKVISRWQALNFYTPHKTIKGGEGKLLIEGYTSDYQISLNTKVHAFVNYKKPQVALHFQGTGNTQSINFDEISLRSGISKLQGKLFLQWLPNVTWHADLVGTQLNPEIYLTDWSGQINFSLTSQGNLANQQLNSRLKISNVSGELKQLPLAGNIDLKIYNNFVTLNHFLVHWGQSAVNLQGHIADTWNLHWDITINNLTYFYKKIFGSLTTQGTITGLRESPDITAFLKGSHIAYGDNQIATIIGKINVSSDLQKPSKLALDINDVTNNFIKIQRGSLIAQGTLNNQQIHLAISNEKSAFDIKLAGGLSNKVWHGTLTQLAIYSTLFDHWYLQNPSAIRLSSDRFSLGKTCIDTTYQSVCTAFNWQKNRFFSAELNATQFALKNLLLLLPENTRANIKKFSGSADLQAIINKNPAGQFKVDAKGSLSNGSLIYNINNENYTIPFNKGDFKIKSLKSSLSSDVNIFFSDNQFFALNLSLPDYTGQGLPSSQQPIQGFAKVYFKEFGLLSLFAPRIQNAKGTLILDAPISGTIAKPVVHGKAELKGSAEIPDLGLKVRDVLLEAVGDQAGIIHYHGSAYTGNGLWQLAGETDLSKQDMPSTLSVRGNKVLLSNTSDYTIVASPNLTIAYNNKMLNINGSLFVPEANIAPKEFQQDTVNLSDDVVIIDPQKPKHEKPLQMVSNLELALGDNVALNVKGVMGNLKGKIQIHYDPQTITTATGNIHIKNGKYSAYGQTLDIRTGRLIYTGGPIDNPGLFVQAIRTVTSTTFAPTTLSSGFLQSNFAQPGVIIVGIELTGTLKNYQASLFSQPSIYSNSDILSTILLGKPTNELTTGSQGQLLLQAATGLNVAGGEISQITQQIKNTFGLDELDISNEAEYVKSKGSFVQTPSVVIGKRIFSRIYLSYSMGILEPINIFKVTLKLTKNWEIQTSSSTRSNGADIYYNFQY